MIKNYTSNSKQTFDVIQKILANHKAKQVFFDYDDNGKIIALAFSIDIKGNIVGFKLPAKVEKVEALFYANKKARYDWQKPEPLNQAEKDQAYRTAWANIRDWLDAQMALVDTDQVKIEEVFLPYAVDSSGKTYFEVIENRGFKLEGGVEEGKVIE